MWPGPRSQDAEHIRQRPFAPRESSQNGETTHTGLGQLQADIETDRQRRRRGLGGDQAWNAAHQVVTVDHDLENPSPQVVAQWHLTTADPDDRDRA